MKTILNKPCVVAVVLMLLVARGAMAVEKLRAINEAENLTLLQDRFLACNTLYKAYKKARPVEQKILKERLFYFSKNFYTDKGFQHFLGGKEFFVKEKYQEALEKFIDADELEKSNTEVLFYLSLSQLWLKKNSGAQETILRAIQINPLETEIIKNRLSLEIAQEKWLEALTTAGLLQKEHADKSVLTQFFNTLAQTQLAKKEARPQIFEKFLQKNKKYPEAYFYLSEFADGETRIDLLKKYNDLCKKTSKNIRDLGLCSRTTPSQ